MSSMSPERTPEEANPQATFLHLESLAPRIATERLPYRPEDLVTYLKKEFQEDRGEGIFYNAGWIPVLQQTGILPVLEGSNPYDPVTEEANHRQWWDAHPEEVQRFTDRIKQSKEALNYIHIGMIIGSIDRELLSSSWYNHVKESIGNSREMGNQQISWEE